MNSFLGWGGKEPRLCDIVSSGGKPCDVIRPSVMVFTHLDKVQLLDPSLLENDNYPYLQYWASLELRLQKEVTNAESGMVRSISDNEREGVVLQESPTTLFVVFQALPSHHLHVSPPPLPKCWVLSCVLILVFMADYSFSQIKHNGRRRILRTLMERQHISRVVKRRPYLAVVRHANARTII